MQLKQPGILTAYELTIFTCYTCQIVTRYASHVQFSFYTCAELLFQWFVKMITGYEGDQLQILDWCKVTQPFIQKLSSKFHSYMYYCTKKMIQQMELCIVLQSWIWYFWNQEHLLFKWLCQNLAWKQKVRDSRYGPLTFLHCVQQVMESGILLCWNWYHKPP